MKIRLGLIIVSAVALSACQEQKDSSNGVDDTSSYRSSVSVMAQLRPKVDPDLVRKIRDEEESARQAKIEELARSRQAQDNSQAPRELPPVDMSPLAGSLPSTNDNQPPPSQSSSQSWMAPAAPPPPPAAGYSINYTSPSTGFVPPPPVVSLSTQATALPFGAPPAEYANPYANPYAYMQQAQQQQPAGRQPGGLFGSATSGAARAANGDDEEAPRKRKEKPLQIITPTGMDPRSPYKQRDELRILWKGALATSLSQLNGDGKFAEGLARVDVSLPPETSRGSLSVGQRQVDAIFKSNGSVDRKIISNVKKAQTDLVQAYYRYLYAYNKFFLTQQQVAARKQELECAESQAEKQRATVDLAQTQQEADSSKEDMRSAQTDLASVVGAQAARTVIKNVSGVSPSLDALAADSQQQASPDKRGAEGLGGILNVFGLGKKSVKTEETPVAAAPEISPSANTGKEKKEKKERIKSVKEKEQIAAKPPHDVAAAPAVEPAEAATAASSHDAPSSPVLFELKGVKTTPRKSILRVVVKNTGGDNFSFDTDAISVAEGSSKLSEASVSAEFDTTVVQPSQEVTGTITIFGRPWNDKITVSLSDGKKPIVMHR